MIRVLLDTNILVSASLFPDSIPAKAFYKAVNPPYHALVCDYSLDELHRVFNSKFPHKLVDYEQFVGIMSFSVEIVPTPPEAEKLEIENKIRDIKDRPILRAAINSRAKLLLTGDKDFLDSGLKMPSIITAADFMRLV